MGWYCKGKRVDVLFGGGWWAATVTNLTSAGRVSISYLDERGNLSGDIDTFQFDPARIHAPKPDDALLGCPWGQELVPVPSQIDHKQGISPKS